MDLVRSHVGMIVQSTTLDTEKKVIAIYGGTSWSKIEGRFLLGASSSYAVNTTGGEATHKLTTSEMPTHAHTYTHTKLKNYVVTGASSTFGGDSTSTQTTSYEGGGAAHNNMPPYKAVYIWERTS